MGNVINAELVCTSQMLDKLIACVTEAGGIHSVDPASSSTIRHNCATVSRQTKTRLFAD